MFDLLAPYRGRRGVSSTPGVTVERIRGTFRASFDVADATDTSVYVGIRRCDFDEDAISNGPITEAHADWMYYQRMWSAAAGGGYPIYEIDVRSRRKIHELEQTICMFTESPGAEAPSTLTGTVSLLLLLP